MRNILTMSDAEAVEWATDHPKEMMITAQSYGICADYHQGYFCNLDVGHVGRHRALRVDKSLIEAWGSEEGPSWAEFDVPVKES